MVEALKRLHGWVSLVVKEGRGKGVVVRCMIKKKIGGLVFAVAVAWKGRARDDLPRRFRTTSGLVFSCWREVAGAWRRQEVDDVALSHCRVKIMNRELAVEYRMERRLAGSKEGKD